MSHVGSHLRDAFTEWVENGATDDEVPGDVFYDGHSRSLRWLFGQLWHCSDIMPWDLCAELEMPAGSTYASAVQALSAEMKRSHAA